MRAEGRPDGRARNRPGEGDRLRGDILDAVNQLLDEQGNDARLTMRAVAKQVGVAAPSIYLHFADKTELVWAALESKYEDLARQMADAADACGTGDPRAGLLAQAQAYCRFGLENAGHYRLMFEVRQPEVERSRLSAHPARLVAGRFRAALNACADDGYPLTLPVYQAAHTLLSGLHGMISMQHAFVPGRADDATHAAHRGLTVGLVDSLVGAQRVPGPTRPEPTPLDRQIADLVERDRRGPSA